MAVTQLSLPNVGTATKKFARENYFPDFASVQADRFLSLFHRFGYICKPLDEGSWFSANEKWRLSDSEILKAIAGVHPKYFLGARAGKASQFAVLDIDVDSKYHTCEALKSIQSVLAAAGIKKTAPYRSSSSGGWHIYIFFDEAISSRDLHKQLSLLLKTNNFEIQKGQLEIFPNPGCSNSAGFGLRLPLQPGWAWIDDRLNVSIERDDLCALEALDLFLFDLDCRSNSQHDFHQLKRFVQDALATYDLFGLSKPAESGQDNVTPIRRSKQEPTEESEIVKEIFGLLPPGILCNDWLKGRQYFQVGLYGASQRADAIFCLSHYFFYGDPELQLSPLGYGHEERRAQLIEDILASKHNGNSKDLLRGRHDAMAQIQRAAYWRPVGKKDDDTQPYCADVPVSWVLENKRRMKDARKRIQQAVAELRAKTKTLTATDIQRLAKCSYTTLYKHQDLWKSDYEQIAEDLFSISTHEYNAVLVPSCEPFSDPAVPSVGPCSFSFVPLSSNCSSNYIVSEFIVADSQRAVKELLGFCRQPTSSYATYRLCINYRPRSFFSCVLLQGSPTVFSIRNLFFVLSGFLLLWLSWLIDP